MKLARYQANEEVILAVEVDQKFIHLAEAGKKFKIEVPTSMNEALKNWEKSKEQIQQLIQKATGNSQDLSHKTNSDAFLSPVKPVSCRDAYAFRQHVATARKNRGAEMIPEFDQFPIFYFTNHLAVSGEGPILVEKDHLQRLDFELEIAIVIGKEGKNIPSSKADEYIAGFTIMNDFSARQLQLEEMKLNLGPAKGKDFATTLGPCLMTPDEIPSKTTEFGNKYSLTMKAYHNQQLISEGNLFDMNWTFGEIIERCSYGVTLKPGEVIGSGTVGTGCYLEINGTKSREAKDGSYQPVWLQKGDTIALEVEKIGELTNTIQLAEGGFSILEKKK